MTRVRLLGVVGLALITWGTAKVAAGPSPTPRLDWLFDGEVSTTTRIGNTLYVGGAFTGVAPRSAALGTWVPLSTTSGAARPGLPSINGLVSVVEPDGSGGYYLAGRFSNAGAGGLAHIRSDGTVDPAFQPQISAPFSVPRLVRVGASLIVAGLTTPLRALDPVTGATLPWVPALPSPNVGPIAGANGRLFVMTSDNVGNRRVTAFDGISGAVVWTSAVVGNSGGFDTTSGAMTVVGSRIIVAIGRLYALDAATGVIDPAWGGPEAPSALRRVDVMAAHGTTLYLAGAFTDFRGQPRNHLAAVDLTTGNLLPWNPDSSRPVAALAVAPDGTVFVQALGTIGGVSRGPVVQIDTAGVATSWAPVPRLKTVVSLAIAVNGDLLVGTVGEVLSGTTARAGLAAFDLATGTLLATEPVVAGLGPTGIVNIVARGTVLYLSGTFTAVNGQPRVNAAAVDVMSGTVLPWPAAGAPTSSTSFGLRGWTFILGDWVYAYLDDPNGPIGPDPPLRRVHAVTGVLDPVWRANVPPAGVLIATLANGQIVAIERLSNVNGLPAVLRVGTLDLATGLFLERSRSRLARSDGSLVAVAVDGDTIYFADPSYNPYNNNVGALRAIDSTTGRDVQVPAISGRLSAVSVVEGRLFPRGFDFVVAGTTVTGTAEVARPGVLTGWRLPASATLAPKWAPQVLGDVMVQTAIDNGLDRVLAFDLSGLMAPANLRARAVGALTEFSWAPTAVPSAGGYVIEGGFGAGQTAASLAVGDVTSVALPLPPGPIHVRVRALGGSEVSNEVVAGCWAPPPSPTGLTATVAGANLSLSWTPAPSAVTTTLLAGTASGSSNIATVPLAGQQSTIAGAVPPGAYFLRMTSSNACGTSAASGEVLVVMGAAEALPAAPTNLAVSTFTDIFSVTATFTWTAPPGSVTGYQIEAGSGVGLADVGTAQLGPSGTFVLPNAPRGGAYYVRVRAVNAAGTSAPSADVVLAVP